MYWKIPMNVAQKTKILLRAKVALVLIVATNHIIVHLILKITFAGYIIDLLNMFLCARFVKNTPTM